MIRGVCSGDWWIGDLWLKRLANYFEISEYAAGGCGSRDACAVYRGLCGSGQMVVYAQLNLTCNTVFSLT